MGGDDRPFKHNSFVWCKSKYVFPLLLFVVLHDKQFIGRCPGILQIHWEYIFFQIDTPVVAEGEGTLNGRVVNGPPYIDPLETTLRKGGYLGSRAVRVYIAQCRCSGVVHVWYDGWF